MASKTYSLRSSVVVAAAPVVAAPSPAPQAEPAPPRYATDDNSRVEHQDLATRAAHSDGEAGARRSYSDVVASRPSSRVLRYSRSTDENMPFTDQDSHPGVGMVSPAVVDDNASIVRPTQDDSTSSEEPSMMRTPDHGQLSLADVREVREVFSMPLCKPPRSENQRLALFQ